MATSRPPDRFLRDDDRLLRGEWIRTTPLEAETVDPIFAGLSVGCSCCSPGEHGGAHPALLQKPAAMPPLSSRPHPLIKCWSFIIQSCTSPTLSCSTPSSNHPSDQLVFWFLSTSVSRDFSPQSAIIKRFTLPISGSPHGQLRPPHSGKPLCAHSEKWDPSRPHAGRFRRLCPSRHAQLLYLSPMAA